MTKPTTHMEMTPRQIVAELDRHIVGQQAAKKAVAIAIRNRWRRQQLAEGMRDEVSPKNIIMIGPTGVGKTEIARRLAVLIGAPFIKVEASKFTEVGYVGRDVESIVRELIEAGVNLVRREAVETVEERANLLAEDRLLEMLLDQQEREARRTASDDATSGTRSGGSAGAVGPGGQVDFRQLQQMMQNLLGGAVGGQTPREAEQPTSAGEAPLSADEKKRQRSRLKAELRQRLHKGELNAVEIEVSVPDKVSPNVEVMGLGMDQLGVDLQSMFERMVPGKVRQRRVQVPEALKVLTAQEAEKLVDRDKIVAEAVRRVEQAGIVFLDEVDKIAGGYASESGQPSVSREGVQRDLLPIIEGCTVNTKYGAVKTDHVLFLAAGAFHMSSPADLIPELQGRFPVRVQLDDLSRDDFVRILTEPKNALIKQYQALLKTDGIDLVFTPDGIDEIARIAAMVNERHENIGARRLHTILERLLDDIAFEAPDVGQQQFVLDRETVFMKLAGIIDNEDLSKYAL